MAEQQAIDATDLAGRFPEHVTVDERTGYEGYLVDRDHLLEVARAIRDEMGYDYLSSVTGVDYLPDNKMEVVYHAYRTTGGGSLVFKVQVDRDHSVVPSLTPLYPGADFQEREAWDLLGIQFEGHPNLKRILMWEGFEGHPLRKDWQEAYFEEESKPFKSRWPDGNVFRAEDSNPFGRNVDYPAGFDPESLTSIVDAAIYGDIQSSAAEEEQDLDTEQLVVNLGPQHPSTHGVFRAVVRMEGETILDLEPVMGYLHRNHE
ncbi:MAG: NADH-quinone oxidoreductase subunit C, partial [Anaerolineales bacterium]|nr:NADH-quinone oxidoreductase subunit C [Anaerolineales bacterium]